MNKYKVRINKASQSYSRNSKDFERVVNFASLAPLVNSSTGEQKESPTDKKKDVSANNLSTHLKQ